MQNKSIILSNGSSIILPNGSEDLCEWCINRKPRPFEDDSDIVTFASLTMIICDYYESIKKMKFRSFSIPYCNNQLMRFEPDINKIEGHFIRS